MQYLEMGNPTPPPGEKINKPTGVYKFHYTIQMSLKNENKNKENFRFDRQLISELGWLHKASFHPAEKNKHDQVASYFANFMMKNKHSLYINHIKGESNNVADFLSSREFRISTHQLTNLLYISFNKQMPQNFRIQQPPENIISLIMLLLESLTTGMAPKANSGRKQIWTGKSGETFAKKLGSSTNFLKVLQDIKKSRSSVPL